MRSLDIMLNDSSDYIRLKTQHRHIQGLRKRRRWSQIHIFVSRSRICCRIQGPSCREKVGKVGVERTRLTMYQDPAKSIQIWRTALCQRLLGTTPRRYIRQNLWSADREGYDERLRWKVRAWNSNYWRTKVNFGYSLIGIGEIVLLPLDVLKIKRQTNPEAFRGRGVFRIVADEGMGLYRGAGWTAARNAPGSFAVSANCAIIFSAITNPSTSSSAAQLSQRSISINLRIITQPAGFRISSLLLLVLQLPFSYPHPWMSSRLGYKIETSRTQKVGSRS